MGAAAAAAAAAAPLRPSVFAGVPAAKRRKKNSTKRLLLFTPAAMHWPFVLSCTADKWLPLWPLHHTQPNNQGTCQCTCGHFTTLSALSIGPPGCRPFCHNPYHTQCPQCPICITYQTEESSWIGMTSPPGYFTLFALASSSLFRVRLAALDILLVSHTRLERRNLLGAFHIFCPRTMQALLGAFHIFCPRTIQSVMGKTHYPWFPTGNRYQSENDDSSWAAFALASSNLSRVRLASCRTQHAWHHGRAQHIWHHSMAQHIWHQGHLASQHGAAHLASRTPGITAWCSSTSGIKDIWHHSMAQQHIWHQGHLASQHGAAHLASRTSGVTAWRSTSGIKDIWHHSMHGAAHPASRTPGITGWRSTSGIKDIWHHSMAQQHIWHQGHLASQHGAAQQAQVAHCARCAASQAEQQTPLPHRSALDSHSATVCIPLCALEQVRITAARDSRLR
eukprot:1161114-Pelagomonas_calceolata.AAC.10